ncbi:uncharacterized protein J3R85_015780 [Psidium guajava]|nr:uncharacterized protein J3R85_015780 [Psidium guajava]
MAMGLRARTPALSDLPPLSLGPLLSRLTSDPPSQSLLRLISSPYPNSSSSSRRTATATSTLESRQLARTDGFRPFVRRSLLHLRRGPRLRLVAAMAAKLELEHRGHGGQSPGLAAPRPVNRHFDVGPYLPSFHFCCIVVTFQYITQTMRRSVNCCWNVFSVLATKLELAAHMAFELENSRSVAMARSRAVGSSSATVVARARQIGVSAAKVAAAMGPWLWSSTSLAMPEGRIGFLWSNATERRWRERESGGRNFLLSDWWPT